MFQCINPRQNEWLIKWMKQSKSTCCGQVDLDFQVAVGQV